MSQYSIEAQDLAKRYLRGAARQRHDSLRDLLADAAGKMLRRQRAANGNDSFWALDGATFDVRHGENVGIIGLNGAGKSTLLKILSRITEPTRGTAQIDGRLGALLEVGTGFHPELSGRENIQLYGSILGMPSQEIAKKFDAIVAFSGIESFIDTPVKRYSSGMYVRLAFSVAAHLEPDILLLDEVLAVGDLAFQRKCMDFAKRLQQRDATVLFVSHNMFSIKTMCQRVIYLRSGRVAYDGDVDTGIALYEKDCALADLNWVDQSLRDRAVSLEACEILDSEGQPRTVFEFGESMTVRLQLRAQETIAKPNVIVAFVRSDGVPCCNFSTELDGASPDLVNGQFSITLRTPPLKLVSEMYSIRVLIREPNFQQILGAQVGGTFHIRHELFDPHFGVFHEPGCWISDRGDGRDEKPPAVLRA